MNLLLNAIRRVRPAPLQALLLRAAGLDRRREVGFRDFRFWVDPSSDLGSHILQGDYEAGMQQVLDRYLPAGGSFLDIGANEGFFSVLASRKVGSAGRVVAVEPQSRLLPVLDRNFRLNGCANCKVVHGVVSDKPGTVSIHLAATTNTGSSSMFRSTRYAVPTEDVQARSLGQLLAQEGLDVVDLAKVDVEGAEYEVITGARDVFRDRRIRAIALEYHPSVLAARHLSMDEIHEVLRSSGYVLDETHGCSLYRLPDAAG